MPLPAANLAEDAIPPILRSAEEYGVLPITRKTDNGISEKFKSKPAHSTISAAGSDPVAALSQRSLAVLKAGLSERL
jgi:hypothetical protein